MFDTIRQDVIGAIRGLIKSPGFAVAALLTLALGIGATSAIFSVVKAVLITPLPYSQPERIVQIFTRWTVREDVAGRSGTRRHARAVEDHVGDRRVESWTAKPHR